MDWMIRPCELPLAAIAAIEAATLAAAKATTFAATAETATLAAAEVAALATESAASRTLFLGTSLVDGDLTAVEFDTVEFLGCSLGLFSATHRHERETARTTGHAIKCDINVGHGTKLLELSTEFVGRGLERQIADVEF